MSEGYNLTQDKYPVLYLLDGKDHFHHGSGIAQYFSAKGLSAPLIVVGIPNTDRTRDMSQGSRKFPYFSFVNVEAHLMFSPADFISTYIFNLERFRQANKLDEI